MGLTGLRCIGFEFGPSFSLEFVPQAYRPTGFFQSTSPKHNTASSLQLSVFFSLEGLVLKTIQVGLGSHTGRTLMEGLAINSLVSSGPGQGLPPALTSFVWV